VKKIFLIGWKDVTLAFRDRAALLMMLLAPFLLTAGLGIVTGRFSGSDSSGLSHIPVIMVNLDGQQLGNSLVDLFQSPNLAALVAPTLQTDPAAARRLVDADQAAAALIIPSGFTASIIPGQGTSPTAPTVKIELYTNPTRPTSVGVIQTILDEYLNRVEIGHVGGQVAVAELIGHGLLPIQQAAQAGAAIGERQAATAQDSSAITLKTSTGSGQAIKFDILAYIAPGMALMFLMYTVSNGGRTLLTEQTLGTLPRLLVAPITTTQVLGGKVFGIYLTGVAQMLILIAASALLFQLQWGSPLAVLVLVLASVAGAVGWGMLNTALARTPGQVSAIGSAIFLIFGILGGSFISLNNMPGWFLLLSKITPNSWGLDGFSTLALGGQLGDILTPLLALLVMGAVLFTLAVVIISRRGFVRR
jgi:ABC-2 type transport system permease protein